MDERGFTLVELLVAVLIVGILAAISLPAFFGQTDKAHDADAKYDVRNAVSQMEACFRSAERYTGCPDAEHGLAPAVVPTVSADGSTYVVAELSETGTTFTIGRVGDGFVRSCDQPGQGGCRSDRGW